MTTSFRILLVDDEPTVAELLTHALQQYFFQASLVCVASAGAARAYLADEQVRRQVDLMLVDIDLKGNRRV